MKKQNLSFLLLFIITVLPLVLSSLVGYIVYQNQEFLAQASYIQWFLISLVLILAATFAFISPTFICLVYGYFLGFMALPFIFMIKIGAIFLIYQFYHLFKLKILDDIIAAKPQAQKLVDTIKKVELKIIFFAKLSPILPFALTNMAFAASYAKLRNILIGGFAGMFPSTIVMVLAGMQAKNILAIIEGKAKTDFTSIAGIVLLFVSIFGIYFFINQTIKKENGVE